MRATFLLRLYAALMTLLSPLLPLWLSRRASRGKEEVQRLSERYGKTKRLRPNGPLIWMHGASVGETSMLLPLIDQILSDHPKAHILVTSGTVTSAKLMTDRLPSRAFHQYVPLDTPKFVSRFLTYWRPDLAIWAESDIWPNLVRQTKVRDIPMILLNARMSEKSLSGWQQRPKTAKALFGCFDNIFPADKQTATGLSQILRREIAVFGNLKDGASDLPYDKQELTKLKRQISQPIWCAASTHAGEEVLVLQAHAEIQKTYPDATLILVPRHPERRDEILRELTQTHIAIRSRGDVPRARTSVYLFDTMGEMGLAYRLSSVALICGSLIKGLTGHNPLEPARLGVAVLSGPHVESFKDTYREMIEFGGAARMVKPDMTAKTIINLWENPDALTQAQRQAQAFSKGRNIILQKTYEALKPYLPEASK